MLNSTLWFERLCREIFITSLLMAEPIDVTEPLPQIEIRSLDYSGWSVPPGKYGFVPAAGIGILRRAGFSDEETERGLDALAQLGSPEQGSRTQEHEGRRLVRVDGGFIVLNYFKYREQDYTAALRQRRYRARQKGKSNAVTSPSNAVTSRNITHADADAYKNSTNTLERDSISRVMVQLSPVGSPLATKKNPESPLAHNEPSIAQKQDELWIQLQQILPEWEISRNVGFWLGRIKENPAAIYEAISDFKDKRYKHKVKNVGAWIIHRYQYFTKLAEKRKNALALSAKLRDEIKKGEHAT